MAVVSSNNSITTPYLTSCPPPFLNLADYPATGGYIPARFCGPIPTNPELSCCLPCPLHQWVYSDSLSHLERIAYWINVPALVGQIFLLASFAALGRERSGVHYLSVGLCCALALLELSFIIPLATRPEECFDAVTPNDMYSSMACAWSGALLEVGSMAGCVWILLRSLWTHVRVCWDVQHMAAYGWMAHLFGWGLPALFLAISLPITGVSYRLGATCLPNPHGAFVTWFGWLIAFACLAALIQIVTTGFCLLVFARSFFIQSSAGSSKSDGSRGSDAAIAPEMRDKDIPLPQIGKRLAWKRVRKVMAMQWRSIVLSFFVIAQIVYFGTVYVVQVESERQDQTAKHSDLVEVWSACLVLSGGDKNQCLKLAEPLRLDESKVVASFFMSALIGIFTFGLMVRRSMLIGWWELIRHPRQRTRSSAVSFNMGGSHGPMRLTLNKPLASEPRGVLPSVDESVRHSSIPEPGDATKRHETTNLFDLLDDEDIEDDRGEIEEDELI